MKSRLLLVLILYYTSLQGKIYDCFTFFNEVELLRVRCEELYDVVDHFVIAESTTSFTGKKKPLYYAENIEMFEKYKDKIIHIVYDFPDFTETEIENHWMREAFARNEILQGLKDCADDDIILLSDLDEIPSSNTVLQIQSYLDNLNRIKIFQKRKIPYHQFICTLDMRCLMYKLDFEDPRRWVNGSKAFPYWMLSLYTPWEIKILHHKYSDMHLIQNAGWHLNTMGGAEKALYKWILTGPLFDSEQALNELKEDSNRLDRTYQGHIEHNTRPVPVNTDYPKYILEHMEYFRSIGWFGIN